MNQEQKIEEAPLKKMNRISKELKMLSDVYKVSGDNNYHNNARRDINKKYGKGWREKLKLEDMKLNPQDYKFKMSYT